MLVTVRLAETISSFVFRARQDQEDKNEDQEARAEPRLDRAAQRHDASRVSLKMLPLANSARIVG